MGRGLPTNKQIKLGVCSPVGVARGSTGFSRPKQLRVLPHSTIQRVGPVGFLHLRRRSPGGDSHYPGAEPPDSVLAILLCSCQSGTRVASRHPPVNLGRNLFPPRRFSYHTRVSRFNGTARQPSQLTCTTPSPAPRAVIRCSQVPRWGQTK
jgi:hypothetical protein